MEEEHVLVHGWLKGKDRWLCLSLVQLLLWYVFLSLLSPWKRVSTSEGIFLLQIFSLSKYDIFWKNILTKSSFFFLVFVWCEISFAGMGLMFGGLYFVLWAKGKEDCGEGDEDKEEEEEESVLRTEFDLEKPLLR